jgi:orotidine-5'-phosphate decarboxylase
VPDHFADRLLKAIREKKSPVCVGIDPVYARLPAAIRDLPDFNDGSDTESALDAVLEFCRLVIKTVAPIVPAVKINSAYFERYYGEGVDAYMELVQEAASHDLVVIGDCKRGDVGHTAEVYAQAQLADPDFSNFDHLVAPDAVTLNCYLGLDALKPFLHVCRAQAKGAFVLVLTSNESATEVQALRCDDGCTVSERVAGLVSKWAGDDGLMGAEGFSCLGAVVAPRGADSARQLRALMPHCLFLIPGYGAQGLTAADIAPCFKPDGSGAVVNASRSIIYAYENPRYSELAESSWVSAVEAACREFAADIAKTAGF